MMTCKRRRKMKGGEVITESEGSEEARGFLGSGRKVKVCCSTCGCQSHGKAGRVTANSQSHSHQNKHRSNSLTLPGVGSINLQLWIFGVSGHFRQHNNTNYIIVCSNVLKPIKKKIRPEMIQMCVSRYVLGKNYSTG